MSGDQDSQATRNRNPDITLPEETPREKRLSLAIAIFGLVASLAVAVYITISGLDELPAPPDLSGAHRTHSQKVTPSAVGGIDIPLVELFTHEARFFDYVASDNTLVHFFVIRSPDGVFHAALDACGVCKGPEGYYQQGDDLICRNCGNRFPSTSVNEVAGDCRPIGLPQTVEGDYLVINVSDLESRKTYF